MAATLSEFLANPDAIPMPKVCPKCKETILPGDPHGRHFDEDTDEEICADCAEDDRYSDVVEEGIGRATAHGHSPD